MRPSCFETPAFDPLVSDTIESFKVPGVAVAIVDGDDISIKNFGHAILPSTLVTDATLFDCASTSKSFTAAALALLVDDDENFPDVKWDTPVFRLMPDDFVMSDPMYTKELTIQDILSHRTGFPNHGSAIMGENAAIPDTPRTVTRNLRNLPINKAIRTEYQYSNIMYTVASYLVEVLSAMSFGEFMKTRLWDPLGMTNTYLQVDAVEERGAQNRLSKGYYWDKERGEHVELPWWRQYQAQGVGSLFSCASDWAKWLIKPRIISDPDFDAETQAEKMYRHTLYALGWEIETYRGHAMIGHDGAVGGYESKMFYLPHWDWGVVMLGNGNGADYVNQIVLYTLVDELLGIPQDDRLNWHDIMQKRREEPDEKEDDPWEIDPRDAEGLPLPLAELAGAYHNVGYRTIIFVVEDDKLVADCSDRSDPFTLCLRHVSGSKLSAQLLNPDENGSEMFKAQFQIRDDGKAATSLGIAIVAGIDEDLIWFDKTS